MPVTEEDLEKKRKNIAKLREQLAETEAKATVNAQEQTFAIEAAQLDAEEARLQAQLAAAKEATKKAVAKEGASNTLAQVTEQLKAAQAPVTPPGVAVDTNDGSADESADEKKG